LEVRFSRPKTVGRDVRLTLADNHPIFLHGLSELLERTLGFRVVEAKLDGLSALQSIRKFQPAIAVLGISMPFLGGVDVLKRVRRDGVATRIVIVTSGASDEDIVAAVKNGAWGIIPKELAAEAFADCLTKVANGERWLPPDIVETAMTREAEWQIESEKIESLLTNRELEISVLAAQGLSNKHVARRAGISEGTVKIHLCNVYKKLGGLNRASLASALSRYYQEKQSKVHIEPLTPPPEWQP
jgi:two-component system, NarL family, nitrate/nitrite response regulator NarL